MTDDLPNQTAHDRIDTLTDQLDALEARVADLEARLDDDATAAATADDALAADGEGDTADADADDGRFGDHRDHAVLDAIDDGTVVGLRTLRSLYHTHTDVQSGDTVKNRIKRLTTDGPFERAGTQAWRYTPAGGDGDAD